jgi:outer membrane protein OmpA-like peptidoglycan-associated protein
MNHSLPSKRLVTVALAGLFLSACETIGPIQQTMERAYNDPCSGERDGVMQAVGAGLGGFLGGKVGEKISEKNGELIGTLIGGVAGSLLAKSISARNCELHKIAQANNVPITFSSVQLEGQQTSKANMVVIEDPVAQFQVNSSKPTPQAKQFFLDMAKQYYKLPDNIPASEQQAFLRERTQMRIFLIGHSDDTGNSAYNAQLSEERAKAVAEIFASAGFSNTQIFYQGAGEMFPVASNLTEGGRAKNRRVEILDVADETAFTQYLSQRRTNLAYLTPSNEASVANTESSKKPAPPAPTAKANPKIDFGGDLVTTQYAQLNFVPEQTTSTLFPISEARADTVANSCAMDRARASRGVKSLDGKQYKTQDYMPGLYGASWAGNANGHLITMEKMAVLRDQALPAMSPTLRVYKDYSNPRAKPNVTENPDVNVYRGKGSILYRVFSKDPTVKCMDIVIEQGTNGSFGVGDTNLVYAVGPSNYQKRLQMQIFNKKKQ